MQVSDAVRDVKTGAAAIRGAALRGGRRRPVAAVATAPIHGATAAAPHPSGAGADHPARQCGRRAATTTTAALAPGRPDSNRPRRTRQRSGR